MTRNRMRDKVAEADKKGSERGDYDDLQLLASAEQITETISVAACSPVRWGKSFRVPVVVFKNKERCNLIELSVSKRKNAEKEIAAYCTQNDQQRISEILGKFLTEAQARLRTSSPPPKPKAEDDRRTKVLVTLDEHVLNDAAVKALPYDKTLYQRGGQLVHVVQSEGGEVMGVTRPANVPVVLPLPKEMMSERLCSTAWFHKLKQTDHGMVEQQVSVPSRCANAIFTRGHWPRIRFISGVVTTPVLRPDGTILESPGYDPATRLFYQASHDYPAIPDRPTQNMARDAAEQVLDVVCDFPFATPAHRAAWLAGVLTPLARFAFGGCTPLFMLDANTRGSGKSLLADLIALIVLGTDFARMANTNDDAEMRKRITSIVSVADRMVLIDNVAGILGCASLDAALTGRTWMDRILGVNRHGRWPLTQIWYASGNNIILGADTSRRVLHVRIDSPLEHPEEREEEEFKYPMVQTHVREHRAELVTAALTILRGYFVAGKPREKLKPWGSFEEWSNMIRRAIVFTGLPDPGETRTELMARSDVEANSLRVLLDRWKDIASPDGATAADILLKLDTDPLMAVPRQAICDLCKTHSGKLPNNYSLGNKLRRLRGRVAGGKYLDSDSQHNTTVWFVVDQTAKTGGGPSGPS